MSIWTCHVAHTFIGLALMLAAGCMSRWVPKDVVVAVAFPGFVMQLNGAIASAYAAAADRGERFHPVVWRLAIFAACILNLLFYALSLGVNPGDGGRLFAVTAVSALASMQFSFLWRHRPFRNPQSEFRNR